MRLISWIGTLVPFLTAFHTTSYAIEHTLTRCGKVMATLHEDHSIPAQSEQYTKVAQRALLRFRAQFLGDFDYSPANKAVVASNDSFSFLRQRVARRLSGILRESNLIEADSDEFAVRQVILGSVYEGAENIRLELQKREALGQQFSSQVREQTINWAFLEFFGLPAVNVGILGTAQITIEYPNFVLPLMTWVIRDVPEVMLRGYGIFHFGRRDEVKLRSRLDSLKEDQWYYQSFDQKISRDIAQRVRRTGDVSSIDAVAFENHVIYPSLTTRLTGNSFIKMGKDIEPSDVSWVRSDELLLFDPETKQPVLIEILRLTEKLPPYPKPVTVKSEKRTPIGELAPHRVRR